jgi:hypothetical protein
MQRTAQKQKNRLITFNYRQEQAKIERLRAGTGGAGEPHQKTGRPFSKQVVFLLRSICCHLENAFAGAIH